VAGVILQKELTVGDRSVTVFLQDGFFNNVESKVSHHSHSNTELHLVIRGRTEYMVSGKYLQLGKCQLAVIPGGMFHGGWNPEPDTLRIAFQISWPVQAPLVLRVQEREAEGLWDAVEEYKRTGNAVRMCLYIALICSYLKTDGTPPKPVEDRGFIISEFFCNNYAQDILLEDLALVLKVSGRQASRLVQKHTGHTFQEELATHRIHAAKRLMQETDMSMERIAEAVGYKSYSGFWKSMRQA
jgi:AraC-like DNA-binding protein